MLPLVCALADAAMSAMSRIAVLRLFLVIIVVQNLVQSPGDNVFVCKGNVLDARVEVDL